MTKHKSRKKRITWKLIRQRVGAFLASPWFVGGIGGLLMALAALVIVSALAGGEGRVTTWVAQETTRVLGWGLYALALCLGGLGAFLIAWGAGKRPRFPWVRTVGILLLLAMGLALTHRFAQEVTDAAVGRGGGLVGRVLSDGLALLLGSVGGVAMALVLGVLGLSFALEAPLSSMAAAAGRVLGPVARWLVATSKAMAGLVRSVGLAIGKLGTPARVLSAAAEAPNPEPAPAKAPPRPIAKPAPSVPDDAAEDDDAVVGGNPDLPWELPALDRMLDTETEVAVSVAELRNRARVIEETCRSLGVPATVVEVNPGPVVTQFGLEPGYLERRDKNGSTQRTKVKVSRIAALANDLALALAASPVRIEAPVPGKGVVGLEVPNASPSMVGLRGVMETPAFQKLPGTLRLALGRDVAGRPVVDDLHSLPHLLVAGATGSGKSVCLSGIIASLLCQNTPKQLRLIMIDPKRVELSAFSGIPHLAAPVIVEMERAVGVLQWVLNEMDRRYKLLARMGARNIQAFNDLVRESPAEQLPYMVVIIDELADLMLVSADAVEASICRLAQLARATGIHLIVATQRPSVDVVTGLIKANLPARIAFAVTSQTDSRVILDSPGAESLLGRGDGLYMAPDSVRLMRMQGCWVSDQELRRLIAWWQAQADALHWSPADAPDSARWDASDRAVQPRLWVDPEDNLPGDDDETDDLLEDAIELVRREQRASVSMLQRHFRIGYTRAARLVDDLDERGVIGPPTGSSKPRDVLLPAPDEPVSPS